MTLVVPDYDIFLVNDFDVEFPCELPLHDKVGFTAPASYTRNYTHECGAHSIVLTCQECKDWFEVRNDDPTFFWQCLTCGMEFGDTTPFETYTPI